MKVHTVICLSYLINISHGWGAESDQSGTSMIEVMVQGVDPTEFVDQMKDRVILFPEENRKLKYFNLNNNETDETTYPRLKDIHNTEDNKTVHPRQRRSNKRVSFTLIKPPGTSYSINPLLRHLFRLLSSYKYNHR